MTVGDVGKAEDANQIQYNIVRVDGQKSCYIPIMKQGGDTNTIRGGQRRSGPDRPLVRHPQADDRHLGVRSIGLRQGSDQDGAARRPHRPRSHQPHDPALSGQLSRHLGRSAFHSALRPGHLRRAVPDGQHGEHDDSGRAGAGLFARHRQFGDLARKHLPPSGDGRLCPRSPRKWEARKSTWPSWPRPWSTWWTFFPVTFLYGVSKFLFSALALAFCLSLLASFVVAMTVIPLFCSRFLKQVPHGQGRATDRRRRI